MAFNPFNRKKTEDVQRSDSGPLSIDGYINLLEQFQYGGVGYSVPGPGLGYTSPGAKQEMIGPTFRSYAALAFKQNPTVFACMNARAMLFSEARFQYRRFDGGRPGDLFGDKSLAILENPWPGGSTGDLLKRMIQYADLSGNAFAVLRPGLNGAPQVKLLRPDWVSIIIGATNDPTADVWDIDSEPLGYVYTPGGYKDADEDDMEFFDASEVAHFAPIPDPEARFRGMSWLTPLIRDIMADKALTLHKLQFMENAATPNLIVKLDVPNLDEFEKWTDKFRRQHEGARNAYKTLFLAAGADATPVGVNMRDLTFSDLLTTGENRIASDAGVPPILIGLTDGLKASTYSNYQQARRHFADHTMRPLWRDISSCFETLVKTPQNAKLWYDDRDIPALQDDKKDAATIQSTQASTLSTLLMAGYTSESSVAAVLANDFSLLVHTQMLSVQLHPPGTAPPSNATQNGNGNQNQPQNAPTNGGGT